MRSRRKASEAAPYYRPSRVEAFENVNDSIEGVGLMGWERDFEHEYAMRQAAEEVVGGEWKGEAPKAYRMGALHAIVSRDEVADGDLRWHISLSRQDRVPTWDELAKCAHYLRPGVVFCIPMPPKSMWLNVHENCLHLHEIHDEPLVEQWKAEGEMTRSVQTAGRRYE